MEIRKVILGIKQDRRLASDRLTKNLARNVYSPIKHTPSLWLRETFDLFFSLVVNNFGIKYTRKEDADHFLKYLWEYN